MKVAMPLVAPPCPPGACSAVRVLNDLEVEVARIRGRALERFGPGYRCPGCGEARLVALGYGPTCHACRVRPVEQHHPRGGHAGPATWRGSSAVNIIAKEGERLSGEVGLFEAGLCARCLFGHGLFAGVRLASLGVEPDFGGVA